MAQTECKFLTKHALLAHRNGALANRQDGRRDAVFLVSRGEIRAKHTMRPNRRTKPPDSLTYRGDDMKVSILHHTITIAPRAGKVVAFAYDGLFEWELSQSASEQHRLHCVSTHLSLSLISLSLSLSLCQCQCLQRHTTCDSSVRRPISAAMSLSHDSFNSLVLNSSVTW
jgi:hypothetical protein